MDIISYVKILVLIVTSLLMRLIYVSVHAPMALLSKMASARMDAQLAMQTQTHINVVRLVLIVFMATPLPMHVWLSVLLGIIVMLLAIALMTV